MLDRLTGIEVFVAASRMGGLSAAGRALNISPAMAAKHLNALELRLRIKLFHRSTRRLTLTDAGQRFLESTEILLQALRDAETEAAALVEEAVGLLRVSAPVSFGALHLAPLIPTFTAKYPQVTVELGLDDRHTDLVRDSWDTAVRVGRLAEGELVARKLAPTTTVVAASPCYLASHGTPKTVKDLAHHDCLGYTLSPPLGVESWSFGREGEVVVPVRGSFRCNSGEALVAAAVAGQGLVYCPRFLACEALRDGRLVALELDVPPIGNGGVYALTHPSRRAAAKTRCWIEFLAVNLLSCIEDF